MEEIITLETYPSYYLEDGKTPNPNYDNEMLLFVVPKWWLAAKAGNVDEFLDTYTWDETIWLYDEAYQEGVILHEESDRRPI